jgi:hypothetical protein
VRGVCVAMITSLLGLCAWLSYVRVWSLAQLDGYSFGILQFTIVSSVVCLAHLFMPDRYRLLGDAAASIVSGLVLALVELKTYRYVNFAIEAAFWTSLVACGLFLEHRLKFITLKAEQMLTATRRMLN